MGKQAHPGTAPLTTNAGNERVTKWHPAPLLIDGEALDGFLPVLVGGEGVPAGSFHAVAETARHRRQSEAVEGEAQLADGRGVFELAGCVTVSAGERGELDEACSELERAAGSRQANSEAGLRPAKGGPDVGASIWGGL